MKSHVCPVCKQDIRPQDEVVVIQEVEFHLRCAPAKGGSGLNPLFRDQ